MCIGTFGHVSGETVSELTSLDITWRWLPSVSSILIVSEDSEEEDSDNEEDEEDEHLRYLHFLIRDLCLFRRRKRFFCSRG